VSRNPAAVAGAPAGAAHRRPRRRGPHETHRPGQHEGLSACPGESPRGQSRVGAADLWVCIVRLQRIQLLRAFFPGHLSFAAIRGGTLRTVATRRDLSTGEHMVHAGTWFLSQGAGVSSGLGPSSSSPLLLPPNSMARTWPMSHALERAAWMAPMKRVLSGQPRARVIPDTIGELVWMDKSACTEILAAIEARSCKKAFSLSV
jgi:hypothetical protein